MAAQAVLPAATFAVLLMVVHLEATQLQWQAEQGRATMTAGMSQHSRALANWLTSLQGSQRADMVVYNRVPKTGSSTLSAHIKGLSARNMYSAVLHDKYPPAVSFRTCGMLVTYDHTPPMAKLRSFTQYLQRLKAGTPGLPTTSSDDPSFDLAKVTANANLKNLAGGTGSHAATYIAGRRVFGNRAKVKIRNIHKWPRNTDAPLLVAHHWPFVDVYRFGAPPDAVAHVNTLREPISRAISSYFYDRFGPRAPEMKARSLALFGNLTVDECMALYDRCGCKGACACPDDFIDPDAATAQSAMTSRSSSGGAGGGPFKVSKQQAEEAEEAARNALECTRSRCSDLYANLFVQHMYFCPWGDPRCRFPGSRAALELAKQVLATQYVAYVVLEHQDVGLAMLELALPRFFSGIMRLTPRVERVTDRKVPVQGSTLQRLRQIASVELEFYDYAVSLLHARHKLLAQLLAKGRGAAGNAANGPLATGGDATVAVEAAAAASGSSSGAA